MVKDKLLETFRENKLEISKAVTTPFPFLETLRDYSLISEQMYQSAQMKYQKFVPMYKGSLCTYGILIELEKKFSTKILEALFHPINLKGYPSLVQIQKHFKDVPLDESASEINGGSQRSSLDERESAIDEKESAINTPQSSVQAHKIPVKKNSQQILEQWKPQNNGVEEISVPERPEKLTPKAHWAPDLEQSPALPCPRSTERSRSEQASEMESPVATMVPPPTDTKVTELRIQKKAVVSRKAKGPKINFHRHELPVTCGETRGTLHKKKMKKGSSEKCIEMADGTWLTLKEFEIKGGRGTAKNWKKSIHCGSHTLHYLMKRKFLPCPPRKYGKRKKLQPCQKRQLVASKPPTEVGTLSNQSPPVRRESSTTGPRKDQPILKEPRKTHWSRSWPPGRRRVISLANRPKYRAQLQARKWISVRCNKDSGRLYKRRFASVYKGKCILTERGWLTPLEFLAIDPAFNIATWTQSIHSGGLTLQTLIENNIVKLHSDSCSCDLCKEKVTYPENDDDCFMCRDEGKLFCCDSCPKSFHKNCHIPSISSESSEEWNCTFCKMRKNKEKEKEGPKNNPGLQDAKVLKQRMYPEQQLKCEFLLMKMYCYSESFLFATDPRLYKAYSPRVREPMWLDLVKKRLSDGTYNTVEGFVLDMRLIFHNGKKFNKDNHFGYLGGKLETKFERDFKAVFNIKEANAVPQLFFP